MLAARRYGDRLVVPLQREEGGGTHQVGERALEPGFLAELGKRSGRVVQRCMGVAEQQRGPGQLGLAIGDIGRGADIGQRRVRRAEHVARLLGLRR